LPEGPECRRMALQLSERVSNRTIQSIEMVSGRYTKKPIENIEKFEDEFPIKILGAGVHGKFIFMLLSHQWSLWSTLGMTGSWSDKSNKHSRVKFVLNDGELYYNDQRNFGTIKFMQGKQPLVDKLNSLGPDLLAEECKDDLFLERISKKKKKTVAEAIMDQSVLSGVGNYVKAESLYLARISPNRIVETLTSEEVQVLNKATRSVLLNSFESGGATIKSYTDFYGEAGDATDRFAVYNKKFDPVGNPVVREKTADGRTTHWVPAIQK